MGKADDPMAVIDSHARVYGVEGLRVVDASSFPFLPPGHPQATICKFLRIETSPGPRVRMRAPSLTKFLATQMHLLRRSPRIFCPAPAARKVRNEQWLAYAPPTGHFVYTIQLGCADKALELLEAE